MKYRKQYVTYRTIKKTFRGWGGVGKTEAMCLRRAGLISSQTKKGDLLFSSSAQSVKIIVDFR
jgi:hypothetical protein